MRLTIRELHIGAHGFAAALFDGRTIEVPLAWCPRLAAATPEERRDWQFCAAGEGIHWPRIDEDISLAVMLRHRC